MIIHPVAEQYPEGICELMTSEQERLNQIAAHLAVTIPDALSQLYVAQAPPPPPVAGETVTWRKLDSSNRPVRDYNFASGAWLSMHPRVPGETIIWTTALPNFANFDEGDAGNPVGTVTDISGPMWAVCDGTNGMPDMRCRFPIGAGTLPSTRLIDETNRDPATDGEEKHLITTDELPEHTHPPGDVPTQAGSFGTFLPGYGQDNLGNEGLTNFANQQLLGDRKTTGVNVTNEDPINLLPPFYAVYFLRRTLRKFYREI